MKKKKLPVFKLDAGAGIYQLQQWQNVRWGTETITDQTDTTSGGLPANGIGLGYGYILGMTSELYGEKDEETGRTTRYPLTRGSWRFGATYRSNASVNGLTEVANAYSTLNLGNLFGRESPSRTTAGLAYEKYTNNDDRYPNKFTFSVEMQNYSSANYVNSGTIYPASNVTDYNVGMEYLPGKSWWPFLHQEGANGDCFIEPIRVGFRTNRTADPTLFQNDYVASCGTALYYGPRGAAGDNDKFKIEPTAEYFLKTKVTMLTLTSSYRF